MSLARLELPGLKIGRGRHTLTPTQGGGFLPGSLFTGAQEGAVYDPSDLSTLWQDAAGTTPVTADGDPVGRIDDKSGNGNHATQSTAAARPLYKTSGGLHWLQGDGVDDWISAAFTITQPWERVSAIRQISWTNSRRVYSGVTLQAGEVYQRSLSPELAIFSGSTLQFSAAGAVGADFVLTERHNGASSRIAKNAGAYTTGNAGTAVPGGMTIFSFTDGTLNANARFYGGTMYEGTLTDAQIAQLRSFYAAKSGVTL